MPYDNNISRSDVAARVPEKVVNDLLTGMQNQSAALTLFPRVSMSEKQQRMPVLSALPTAYFLNGDTALKQTTEAAWDNKYLNAEEIAVIVPIAEAVLDDAHFDIWGEVKPLLEQAGSRVLDAAIFFDVNKPASWPNAIVTDAIAKGKDVDTGSAANIGGYAADVSNLFAQVEESGYDVSGVIANRIWRGRLRNARNADGNQLPEVSGSQAFGVDITYPMRGLWPDASVSGNTSMIAGDFSEGILAIRQDFTYKILTEAVIQNQAGEIQYNLAQQDMVALRMVFRVAWQLANVLNYDDQSANRYPFAVLTTP